MSKTATEVLTRVLPGTNTAAARSQNSSMGLDLRCAIGRARVPVAEEVLTIEPTGVVVSDRGVAGGAEKGACLTSLRSRHCAIS